MKKDQAFNPGRKFDQVRRGAREVFFRDGYAGSSVDDIASASRVSKATLYSYFPEKSLIFQDVLSNEMDQISARAPIQIDTAMPLAEALALMARQIAGWLVSQPVVLLHRASIAEAFRFPDLARRYHALLQTLLHDTVREHLDRWVAMNQLHIDDTSLAAAQLVRLSGAVVHEPALLAGATEPDESTIHRIGDGAARVFLAAHGAERSEASLAAPG
ncbi:TetR/AcrR family transcriptional regulator [Paracoccus salsus]|uniref:TetR/AcrR family transcriptional regulator n=1 Tax=Paracoccus salsus TaxID=2911061 RepID=UPI001F3F4130|nr:TetR/AcrR family transcriptional regulator [Paracoccus salsus]MCF3973066.1 TetR/AcrR family transcriptional regulator [Paracoccus salsus]